MTGWTGIGFILEYDDFRPGDVGFIINVPGGVVTINSLRQAAAAPALYEALKPLAECEIIEADVPLLDSDSSRYFITMGEIRAARAALASADGGAA